MSLLGAVLLSLALEGCGAPEPARSGMAYIPAGEFRRGSQAGDPKVYPWEATREQPQHAVFLDGYFIDRHEVTNAEYERFRPEYERNRERSPCDDCPVVDVRWFEAREYCAAQGKRLPTEAEWEKAAKAGSENDPEPLADHAWFAKNSITRTQAVGQKKPNGFGLYDMLGNAREWTADWYDQNYYAERVRINPKGPPEGARRSERGGAFSLPARGVTTTIRYNHPPEKKLYFLGFRCAAD